MSSDSELIRCIRDNLAKASRKEATSITLVLKDIPEADCKNLLEILQAINKVVENPTKEPKESKGAKEQDSGIVIGKLRSWLESIRNETVELRTCFPEAEQLLTAEEINPDTFLKLFQDLARLADSLEKLKTAVDFKKAEVINKMLEQGMDKRELAKELECNPTYIERMHTFYDLCVQFPALRYYNTLLQHRRNIEKNAAADPDFDSKLRTPLTPRFNAVCNKPSDLRQLLKSKTA